MKWDEYTSRMISDMVDKKGFYDPSDAAVKQKDHVISFTHLATSQSVSFKAFVTEFSDSYESNWNSESVYGRMDPIQTFSHTHRTISLGWEVVAASKEEAISNLNNCSKLLRMLYPTYEGTSMAAPPLLRLKFLNLAQSAVDGAGLTGTAGGFTYTPDFEQGVFDVGRGTIYPKVVKLECTFTVLHEHLMGEDANVDSNPVEYARWGGFPYNVVDTSELSEAMHDGSPPVDSTLKDRETDKAEEGVTKKQGGCK